MLADPADDPLRPPAEVADHPLVRAAEHLAASLLRPQAAEVDRSQVPLTHVRALADAGLLAPTADPAWGGGGAPAAVGRAVTEVLAGACGATWFVLTQHAAPVRMLTTSGNEPLRQRWLRPLASGQALGAIAFAHLRRPGPPAVAGTRVDGGWLVSGSVPWLTSWGLADVVLLGFRDGDDVVFALVEARPQPGLVPGAKLALAAMQAAGTVTVQLSDHRIGDEQVVERLPYDEWAASDAPGTANATPASFGLLRAIVGRLHDEGARRGEDDTVALARRLAARGGELRAQAYHLVDDVPAAEAIDERLAVRASTLALLTTAGSALVAAGAGGSMSLDHPAQRWAREALFHQVQAQTRDLRAATMQEYAGRV